MPINLVFSQVGGVILAEKNNHIVPCFAVCYKLIPAHNVFVLYISQYLTFALHFVGQGPVSMYNNFIYAIGFSQHFNGLNWVHILLDIFGIQSTLHFIDVSLCSVPPRPIALSSLLSSCWSLCASSSLSNSSGGNKRGLRPSQSHNHYQPHHTKAGWKHSKIFSKLGFYNTDIKETGTRKWLTAIRRTYHMCGSEIPSVGKSFSTTGIFSKHDEYFFQTTLLQTSNIYCKVLACTAAAINNCGKA